MSIANEPLEWRSVLDVVIVDTDIRAVLPALDQQGIVAYTDGACITNPGGPAGWSALLWAAIDTTDGKVREGALCLERYGYIPKAPTTTNNRAEIAAVLAVLSLAPPALPLLIYSDSEYTIKVAQGTYKMKANPDLWEVYRKLLSYRTCPPTFEWVRGHTGHAQNERADELAGLGAWNDDRIAYQKWQASQTFTAMPSAQLATLRQKVQKLQSTFSSSSTINAQERTFIADMAKRLQKQTFMPTEKQNNWVNVLVRKYRIES